MSWFFVGSAVLSVTSSLANADAQRKQAHFQADVATQKAKIAADQANVNEDAQRRRAALALGQQRAAIAQSGTGADGTNAQLAAQSGANAELDALNIRYGGQLGVMSDNADADAANMAADHAQSAGYLNAAAGALTSYGGYLKANAKTPSSGGVS